MNNAIEMADYAQIGDYAHDDEILKLRVAGLSVRSIARRFAISVDAVDDALGRVMARLDNHHRVRAAQIELERLDFLHRAQFAKAMQGDTAATNTCVRISERRAALLALDSPVRVDIVERSREATPAPSSTERIRAAIDRLTGPQRHDPPA
ncbi:hypothetical protein [Bradyrhizobium cenepequi]